MQNIFAFGRALGYAIEGLKHAFKEHQSFKIEVIAAFIVTMMGFLFQITHGEWIIIIWVIFSVLVAELLNTAIETALDYLAIEHHVDVKIAKDVSAGAVLLLSIASMIVGLIIFLPYIFNF